MGEKRRRKKLFLSQHSVCCYCGVASTTEDHCPARICFRDRIGPEGWSFPSCADCNHAISDTEQIVAFFIRALDFEDKNLREADLLRLYNGLNNNYPDLLPNLYPTANQKRRYLREMGLKRPDGEFLDDVPLMPVPEGLPKHLSFFARKLTAALFYRSYGVPITPDHTVFCRWFQSFDDDLKNVIETLSPAWNKIDTGKRSNLDFGDQLSIVFATGAGTDVFSYVAQFSTSLCFWGGAALPPKDAPRRENWDFYKPIKLGP